MESVYLAALHLFPHMTHGRLRYLLGYGQPRSLWEDFDLYMFLSSGFTKSQFHEMEEARRLLDLRGIERELKDGGIRVLSCMDEEFPPLLHHVVPAPAILYVKGSFDVLSEDLVSVVGSRSMTSYGRRMVGKFVGAMLTRSVRPVSGLALGVDGEVARVCVERGKAHVAVLGTGVDVVYPASHADLFQKVVDTGGALVSDFPLGTLAKPYHFPLRNRLIAMLSRATVVIEAKRKAGSLVTARLALEYGKDVYVVPGPVGAVCSEGCNQLLLDGGAEVLIDAEQLIGAEASDKKEMRNICEIEKNHGFPQGEKGILQLLEQPMRVEELSERLAKPVSGLLVELSERELLGELVCEDGVWMLSS